MDSLFEILDAYTKKIAMAGRLKLACLALFLSGILLSVLGLLINIEMLTVTLGSLAGLGWMITGYMVWHSWLPLSLKEKLDLRGRLEIKKRRWIIAWVAVLWFLLLAVFGKSLHPAIMGGINVAVLLTFWRIIGMTKLERALATEEAKVSPWVEELEELEELEEPNA